MPDPDQLPTSMKAVTDYNGVKWIHDYQDACVDKIDRFIRGDAAIRSEEGFIETEALKVFGLLHCHGDPMDKAKHFYCLL